MARLRFMAAALLALALAGNSAQMGRSAGQSDGPSLLPASYVESNPTKIPAANDRSCVIYSLTEMGYDADLGRWIAQTIPEMIESKSWQQSGGSGVLRYYAPKNILIVNNSADVQAKVDGFLKNMKSSLPKTNHTSAGTKKSSHGSVVPADYRAPALVGTSCPLPEKSGYPVPAPVKAPKHLFHFLIRYEGEGIIDDNVVKYMKLQNQSDKGANSPTPGAATANAYSTSGGTPVLSSGAPAGPVQYSGYSTIPSAGSANPPSTLAPSTSVTPPVAQPKQKEDTKEEKKEKPGVQSQPTR